MKQKSDRTRAFWREHVHSYLTGELTLNEYCRRHQLNRRTFGGWRRRLAASCPSMPPSREPVQLVRVELESSMPMAVSGSGFEVVVSNGRCIRVPVDFDAAALSRLLDTVESSR